MTGQITDDIQLPTLMTSDEVAEFLGITESTVRRMIRRGDLPGSFCISARAGYRIPNTAVQAYIRNKQEQLNAAS